VRAIVLLMASAVAIAVGCSRRGSSACYEVCERANQCVLKDRSVDIECDYYCPAVEDMQDRMAQAGFDTCETQFNDHMSCWQTNLGQICNTAEFTECTAGAGTPGAAWTACMQTYCNDAFEREIASTALEPNCRLVEIDLPDGGTETQTRPGLRSF
jgi:hypothetical protein